MTNNEDQSRHDEIQELEGRLKTLKQHTMGAKGNSYLTPAAILIAGVFIAGAVLYSGQGSAPNKQGASIGNTGETASPPPGSENASLKNLKPITEKDHIRGNKDAPVKIVEFSDMECPFCKRFHATMQQVMDEYGKNGQVAWIYRHFPLDSIHPVKARAEALASECANELGGNDAFWKFTDRMFELTRSNNQTDIDTVLPQIAKELGLNEAKFKACRESKKYDREIEENLKDATASGGNGTPYSIVIAPNGKKFPINGAQPYAQVQSIIQLALEEK